MYLYGGYIFFNFIINGASSTEANIYDNPIYTDKRYLSETYSDSSESSISNVIKPPYSDAWKKNFTDIYSKINPFYYQENQGTLLDQQLAFMKKYNMELSKQPNILIPDAKDASILSPGKAYMTKKRKIFLFTKIEPKNTSEENQKH
ncbi:hypothetical protein EDEG_03703 [Edhazardia aedis USNM 41457]|uniref:Uncharacterized protein n=1 Tax=Edhazardia aedis (strain USNM 41457) TaxID=1003232 RepID=J8ZQ42_EDHAE|nr:hypothetical protein EDEG_03703 [Edhazardia aedis USNM 41457]|eukprot:EJW01813.1 hypothetical protein EDEG_03703 [Edhazardia aedis USNM 41457]